MFSWLATAFLCTKESEDAGGLAALSSAINKEKLLETIRNLTGAACISSIFGEIKQIGSEMRNARCSLRSITRKQQFSSSIMQHVPIPGLLTKKELLTISELAMQL